MFIMISAVIVAGAVIYAALAIVGELRRARSTPEPSALDVLTLLAPGIAAAADNPTAILQWQRVAATARTLAPQAFGELEKVTGGRFPFTAEQIQAAHSRWTAQWLAWERSHDGEYKLKAAEAEAQVAISPGNALARARFEAIEREKLDLYQRRYEEYVRTAKALQALIEHPGA